MGIPSTVIYTCSGVPLSPRYDHTIFFDNLVDQETYFQSKMATWFSVYTYLRKTWSVKVQASLAEADKWNYLYFRNDKAEKVGNSLNWSAGKCYYYFITNVEYVNDNTVELFLEMDVLQTYQFDMHFQTCFVERAHADDDTPGANLVDEGLDLGELVTNEQYEFWQLKELCIMTLASINPNYSTTATPVQALPQRYNNTFSGLRVYATPINMWQGVANQLESLSEAGFIDGIISMWMYPRQMVVLAEEENWDSTTVVFKAVGSCAQYGSGFEIADTPETVNGYHPRNNKLLTYPYNFLYCTNNMGGSAVYHYEKFNTAQPTFNVVGSISPEAGVLLYPYYYNGVRYNIESGLEIGGYPTCTWDADIYKMWLAQNQNTHAFTNAQGQVKIAAGAATAAIGGLAGLLTGNIGGAVNSVAGGATMAYSGAAQIGELLAQKKDMEIQPPQARGRFTTSPNITAEKHNFQLYRKSVSKETAKIIDDYFTMYGYKQNRIMYPIMRTRQNYNYVKTVNCLCYGELPQSAADKIASIFDKGVTIWWNPTLFGQYSAGNPIFGAG